VQRLFSFQDVLGCSVDAGGLQTELALPESDPGRDLAQVREVMPQSCKHCAARLRLRTLREGSAIKVSYKS
jgi:hypothetical protein